MKKKMILIETFSLEWCKQMVCNLWSIFSGIFMIVVGYFLPIRNIVHVVFMFFILDILFGYWAARKLRNEKFSTRIVWQKTIPRMLISIVLIISAYLWDTTFNQEIISTYNLIGWFISGILLYSIGENGYKITAWKPFHDLSGFMHKKFEEETGIDIIEEGK